MVSGYNWACIAVTANAATSVLKYRAVRREHFSSCAKKPGCNAAVGAVAVPELLQPLPGYKLFKAARCW